MKPIRAALVVQHSIAGEYEKNLSACIALIDDAAKHNADFIVFPEMNLTGYTTGAKIEHIAVTISDHLTQTFKNLARKYNTIILIGIAEKKKSSVYATHLVFSSSGNVDSYRKIHTAPFEKPFFTSGDQINVFKEKKLNFGIQLCYDAHFPELSTSMALKKADVIFIPHASPRGTSQEKYDSWTRHLRARAFDNGIYIAACNQTGYNGDTLSFPGVSLFIGPDGNVISKTMDNKPHIHYVDIDENELEKVRSHKMRYFLPNRGNDLFPY